MSRLLSPLGPIPPNPNTTLPRTMEQASTPSSLPQPQPRILTSLHRDNHNSNCINSSNSNSTTNNKCSNPISTRAMRRRPRASNYSRCQTTFQSGRMWGWRRQDFWERRSRLRLCLWWIRGSARGSCRGRSTMSWGRREFMRVVFR